MNAMTGPRGFHAAAGRMTGQDGVASLARAKMAVRRDPGAAVPFGLANTNRSPADHTTKNRFEPSSLPMSLACMMEERGIAPVLLSVTPPGSPSPLRESETPFSEVFGLGRPLKDCRFDFEAPAPEHEALCRHSPAMDVIISNPEPATLAEARRAPLEIKVTVSPDETTGRLRERDHRQEIVFRPVTMQAAAMNLFIAMSDGERAALARKAAEAGIDCHGESLPQRTMTDLVDWIMASFHALQRPLVLNLYWSTVGKSTVHRQAWGDMFVWTDLAYVDVIRKQVGGTEKEVGKRCLRALERYCRALFQLCVTGRYSYGDTVHGGRNAAQTDKEISLPGTALRRVLKHRRAACGVLTKELVEAALPENYGDCIEIPRSLAFSMHLDRMLQHAEETAIEALRALPAET